jgi:2-methylcitrate dehydratase PrpD
VTKTDGSSVVEQVDDAKGSLGNPMTDSDLEAKFMRLATPVLPDAAPQKVIAAVNGIRDASDVSELIALCAPASTSASGS